MKIAYKLAPSNNTPNNLEGTGGDVSFNGNAPTFPSSTKHGRIAMPPLNLSATTPNSKFRTRQTSNRGHAISTQRSTLAGSTNRPIIKSLLSPKMSPRSVAPPFYYRGTLLNPDKESSINEVLSKMQK